jgi:hypothetical protein
MQACGRNTVVLPEPLIQIRRRFVAVSHKLRLTVETDASGWIAEVVEDGRTLYSARRSSAAAAKSVAVEFAAFRATGLQDGVRQELIWNECW